MSGTSTPFIFTGGAQVIKSSASTLYGIDGMAPDFGFLQVYNKANAPIIGTDIPVATLPVIGAQRVAYPMPEGMILSNGLAGHIHALRGPGHRKRHQ